MSTVTKGRKSVASRTSALEVGSPAPDFELQGHRGKPTKETVRLRDFRGKKNVVVVFYPLDWTAV